MKKTYMTPETKDAQMETELILNASGGVETGNKPGDEYNSGDISYSRREQRNVWDDEEIEEDY